MHLPACYFRVPGFTVREGEVLSPCSYANGVLGIPALYFSDQSSGAEYACGAGKSFCDCVYVRDISRLAMGMAYQNVSRYSCSFSLYFSTDVRAHCDKRRCRK